MEGRRQVCTSAGHAPDSNRQVACLCCAFGQLSDRCKLFDHLIALDKRMRRFDRRFFPERKHHALDTHMDAACMHGGCRRDVLVPAAEVQTRDGGAKQKMCDA